MNKYCFCANATFPSLSDDIISSFRYLGLGSTGLRNLDGIWYFSIVSVSTIKNSLSPVAIPRFTVKKFPNLQSSLLEKAVVFSTYKLDHLPDAVKFFLSTIIFFEGVFTSSPHENSMSFSDGLPFLKKTIVELTSASLNCTSSALNL